jgi:Tfp pilus assembly protein PilF
VAFYNRGKLRLENGNKKGAIADLKKTLKVDPAFGRAYRLLSRLLKAGSTRADARKKKMLPDHEVD